MSLGSPHVSASSRNPTAIPRSAPGAEYQAYVAVVVASCFRARYSTRSKCRPPWYTFDGGRLYLADSCRSTSASFINWSLARDTRPFTRPVRLRRTISSRCWSALDQCCWSSVAQATTELRSSPSISCMYWWVSAYCRISRGMMMLYLPTPAGRGRRAAREAARALAWVRKWIHCSVMLTRRTRWWHQRRCNIESGSKVRIRAISDPVASLQRTNEWMNHQETAGTLSRIPHPAIMLGSIR